MRGAAVVTGQIVGAAIGLAVIGGLVGFLVVHFAHKGGAALGFGWGMLVLGALAGLAAGSSGSPSENRFAGSMLGQMRYGGWARGNVPLPQSPLQVAFGGVVAFGAGLAVLVLFAY